MIAAPTREVTELLRRVDDARHARQGEYERFLTDLTPRLSAAGIAERRRDRHLAHRFNVFRYLSQDELGLSRIIADLLDPTAEHGQGASFLEAMLEALPETRGRFGKLDPTAAATGAIRVRTERRTTAGRFIDITVDIPEADGRFCLAFENKPYAHDLDNQLKDYLEYLGAPDRYEERFLLVYLPPVHRQPAEAALPKVDRERWRKHFTIMPYTGGEPSLTNWFATCRSVCRADAVSWFLRHAESFCKQRFGESTMTTNPDTRFIHKYLADNPGHLRAALAVHDAWRLVRADLCERFLKHLCHEVEKRLRAEPFGAETDLRVRCRYGGERKYSNALWITRESWIRHEDTPSNEDGRHAIKLQSSKPGPNGWFWGVNTPKPESRMTKPAKERRAELIASLRRRGLTLAGGEEDWWAAWEYLPRYSDWDPLVPELHEECDARGGPITDFYVEGLLRIAEHAIPAINEVEAGVRAGE